MWLDLRTQSTVESLSKRIPGNNNFVKVNFYQKTKIRPSAGPHFFLNTKTNKFNALNGGGERGGHKDDLRQNKLYIFS